MRQSDVAGAPATRTRRRYWRPRRRPAACDSSPARNSRKQNGVQCQMSTRMTESSAVSFAPSQSSGSMPRRPSAWLARPKSKFSISFQIAPDDDARDQDRQDEDRPVEHSSAGDPTAKQGQQEAEHHLAGHGAEREDGRVGRCPPGTADRRRRSCSWRGRPVSMSQHRRPAYRMEAHPEQVYERQHAEQQHDAPARARR